MDTSTGECGFYDSVSLRFVAGEGTGSLSCTLPAKQVACDNLSCQGAYLGSSLEVDSNTIHTFSYTLTNTGTVDYSNYTGDIISAWFAESLSGASILLYPATVSDNQINAEILDLLAGNSSLSPSAIANLNGSTCSDIFYGPIPTTTACSTGVLAGTLNEQYSVGQSKTYNYKFVVYVPSFAAGSEVTAYFGLKSGAQGLIATNWQQQVHPYISANLST